MLANAHHMPNEHEGCVNASDAQYVIRAAKLGDTSRTKSFVRRLTKDSPEAASPFRTRGAFESAKVFLAENRRGIQAGVGVFDLGPQGQTRFLCIASRWDAPAGLEKMLMGAAILNDAAFDPSDTPIYAAAPADHPRLQEALEALAFRSVSLWPADVAPHLSSDNFIGEFKAYRLTRASLPLTALRLVSDFTNFNRSPGGADRAIAIDVPVHTHRLVTHFIAQSVNP